MYSRVHPSLKYYWTRFCRCCHKSCHPSWSFHGSPTWISLVLDESNSYDSSASFIGIFSTFLSDRTRHYHHNDSQRCLRDLSATAMSTSELSIEFVNADDALANAIALPALGIVAVSVRLYLRRTKQKKIGVDDWLIVAALVSLSCWEGRLVSTNRGNLSTYRPLSSEWGPYRYTVHDLQHYNPNLFSLYDTEMGSLAGIKAHALGYPSAPYPTPLAELTGLTPEQRIVELVRNHLFLHQTFDTDAD
jgi:hypothetical protein